MDPTLWLCADYPGHGIVTIYGDLRVPKYLLDLAAIWKLYGVTIISDYIDLYTGLMFARAIDLSIVASPARREHQYDGVLTLYSLDISRSNQHDSYHTLCGVAAYTPVYTYQALTV